MNLSFKKLFYILGSLIAGTIIMIYAKGILIPLFFALLFSFILYPVVKWLKNKNIGNVLSIIISMIGVTLLLAGVVFIYSAQVVKMADEFTNFQKELVQVFDTSVNYLNEHVRFIPTIRTDSISSGLSSFFEESGFVFVSNTLGLTSTILSYLTLSIVFSFLILLYSRQLTNAMTEFSAKENHATVRKMLSEVQKVGQQYLTGMLLLVLILGVLNSLGLFFLGIDYAFFFGFLAALLAIVPYVGSFVGGLLPTIYAFVIYDSYWYPMGVIIIFWVVQFLEGNFLNPKIVGGSLKVNALFSILSLIGGGLLWGIPGMILFLPLVAMLRIVSTYFEELKPLALLIGDSSDESDGENAFLGKIKSVFQNKENAN